MYRYFVQSTHIFIFLRVLTIFLGSSSVNNCNSYAYSSPDVLRYMRSPSPFRSHNPSRKHEVVHVPSPNAEYLNRLMPSPCSSVPTPTGRPYDGGSPSPNPRIFPLQRISPAELDLSESSDDSPEQRPVAFAKPRPFVPEKSST